MILPSMNSEELVREIMKDYQIVNRKGKYELEKLRRPALKSQSRHVQRIFDYKSKNINNWIIFCDYDMKDPLWYVVVHFVDKMGLQAYLVDEKQRVLYHYSGHFIHRFNERFLHETELSKTEILKRYLSKNASAYIEVLPDTEKYHNPVFGKSREGVVLGNVELQGLFSIIHIKTFIADDMIFENQQEKFDYTSGSYKQYWDEVYKKRKQSAYDD
jgi:hypothetical protein